MIDPIEDAATALLEAELNAAKKLVKLWKQNFLSAQADYQTLEAERDALRAKLKDARNRLDTIRETNPEISLDHDIELIDAELEKDDD